MSISASILLLLFFLMLVIWKFVPEVKKGRKITFFFFVGLCIFPLAAVYFIYIKLLWATLAVAVIEILVVESGIRKKEGFRLKGSWILLIALCTIIYCSMFALFYSAVQYLR
jgi:hypothetical protein